MVRNESLKRNKAMWILKWFALMYVGCGAVFVLCLVAGELMMRCDLRRESRKRSDQSPE